MSRSDWSDLDSAYTEKDIAYLEWRHAECIWSGETFDAETEIQRLRDEREDAVVTPSETKNDTIKVSFYDPRAWTFLGIIKLLGHVAFAAMLIGWIWGR